VNKATEQQERSSENHHFTRPGIELLSLTKTGRHKLEAYQHLFYLLQTEPRYLSQLWVKLARRISAIEIVQMCARGRGPS
jgi:hypothetical protein